MSATPNASGAWLPAEFVLKASLDCIDCIVAKRKRSQVEEAARLLSSRWHPFIRTEARARRHVERTGYASHHNSDQHWTAWNLQAVARQVAPDETMFVSTSDYRHIHSFYEGLGRDPDPSQPDVKALAA